MNLTKIHSSLNSKRTSPHSNSASLSRQSTYLATDKQEIFSLKHHPCDPYNSELKRVKIQQRTRSLTAKSGPAHTAEGRPRLLPQLSSRTWRARFLQLPVSLHALPAHHRKELCLRSPLHLCQFSSQLAQPKLFSSVRCSSGTRMGAPTVSNAVTHQLLAKNHEN